MSKISTTIGPDGKAERRPVRITAIPILEGEDLLGNREEDSFKQNCVTASDHCLHAQQVQAGNRNLATCRNSLACRLPGFINGWHKDGELLWVGWYFL